MYSLCNHLQVSTGQVEDQMIHEISYGPTKFGTSFNGSIVNKYRIHTKDYGLNRATMNSGCVLGEIYMEKMIWIIMEFSRRYWNCHILEMKE